MVILLPGTKLTQQDVFALHLVRRLKPVHDRSGGESILAKCGGWDGVTLSGDILKRLISTTTA
jgi:hypothetical protein